MDRQDYTFTSDADGLELTGYAWSTTGSANGTVLIAHGLAEHGKRYARFAKALNAAGLNVHAYDHRGHGQSLTAPGALGDFGAASWDGLVRDLVQQVRTLAARDDTGPLILFGHSMGSFAVQQALPDVSTHLAGAILSGSTDLATVAELVAQTGEAPSFETYNAAFAPNRTEFDWLSRDEAEVDAYIADPLCGFDAPDAVSIALIMAAPIMADPARIDRIRKDLPLLLMAGDMDPLNASLALLHVLQQRYESAGLSQLSTQYYAGGRHEMLNETNRDEVTNSLIAWVKSHS